MVQVIGAPPKIAGFTEKEWKARIAKNAMFRCLNCPERRLKMAEVVPHLMAVHSIALIQPERVKKPCGKKNTKR